MRNVESSNEKNRAHAPAACGDQKRKPGSSGALFPVAIDYATTALHVNSNL
jgi:hypothetical protein